MLNSRVFVARLAEFSFPNVFNPYRDKCDEHDHSESPQIRRLNLERYLDAVACREVESIWLGRDCGYRGGRRTGIALTDEPQLKTLQCHFGCDGIAKATVGAALKERTATEVWRMIQQVNANVFLWNVFPFHPFESGNPMSNRPHTAREFEATQNVLADLIQWLQPTRILALGADARRAVPKVGFSAISVRHPSYGGHLEFAETIRQIYKTGSNSEAKR